MTIQTMPELPEVQTIVSDLKNAAIIGCRIEKVEIATPKIVATGSACDFARLLGGKKICAISRRAKFVVTELDSNYFLLMHLRMTGHIFLEPASSLMRRHVHAKMLLTDGRQLVFEDLRQFGRLYLTKEPEKYFARLGMEPLDDGFTHSKFEKGLASQRKIKPLLLDQSFVAGIGNIYADEALWEACVHPETPAALLPSAKRKALFLAIRKVLRQGIDNRGTSLRSESGNFRSIDASFGENKSFLSVHGRKELPCPRCKNTIIKTKVAQRGTYLCPHCQK